MVLKAVSALEDAHRSQVYNYLHTMHYALIRAICVICATKKPLHHTRNAKKVVLLQQIIKDSGYVHGKHKY